jgi:hypothetical protein
VQRRGAALAPTNGAAQQPAAQDMHPRIARNRLWIDLSAKASRGSAYMPSRR